MCRYLRPCASAQVLLTPCKARAQCRWQSVARQAGRYARSVRVPGRRDVRRGRHVPGEVPRQDQHRRAHQEHPRRGDQGERHFARRRAVHGAPRRSWVFLSVNRTNVQLSDLAEEPLHCCPLLHAFPFYPGSAPIFLLAETLRASAPRVGLQLIPSVGPLPLRVMLHSLAFNIYPREVHECRALYSWLLLGKYFQSRSVCVR